MDKLILADLFIKSELIELKTIVQLVQPEPGSFTTINLLTSTCIEALHPFINLDQVSLQPSLFIVSMQMLQFVFIRQVSHQLNQLCPPLHRFYHFCIYSIVGRAELTRIMKMRSK